MGLSQMACVATTEPRGPQLRHREVFSTGHVAAVCRVAPRTVAKWVDSGTLRGYRVPGPGNERRVRRADLVAFLRANSIPLGPLGRPGCDVLLVSADPPRCCGPLPGDWYGVRVARDPFAAGVEAALNVPDVLVADAGTLGRRDALIVAERVAAPATVFLPTEDCCCDPELATRPGWLVAALPVDPAAVAELVRRAGPKPEGRTAP